MPKKTAMQIRKRFSPFTEGQPFFHNVLIEPGIILRRIIVKLTGTVTLSAGTTNGVSTGENPGNLLGFIDVDAEPVPGGLFVGGKIVHLDARAINKLRCFDKGYSIPDFVQGASGITGAAQAWPIDTELQINFSQPLLDNPDDTALRLDQFQNVQLTVNTATLVGMLVGNDRTVVYTSLTIDVYEDRVYSPGFWPVATLYQDSKKVLIQAASTEFKIDSQLPQADAFMHALLITESTGKALVDTILNKATVSSGSEEVRTLYSKEIKSEQQGYITDLANSQAGLYFIDLLRRGAVADAQRGITFTLDVNNPGTDNVQIVSRRLQPRIAKPA